MYWRRRDFPVFPYRKQQINAGSAVDVPYQSVDGNLEPVELSALRWRYDNLTDSVVLQGWTSVSEPESSGSITIPASLNAMTRPYRDIQLNQVIFELTDTNGNVKQQLAYVEVGVVFQGAG